MIDNEQCGIVLQWSFDKTRLMTTHETVCIV